MTLTFAYPWCFILLVMPFFVSKVLGAYGETKIAVRAPWFGKLAEFSGGQPGEGAVVRRRTGLEIATGWFVWTLLVCAVASPQTLEPPIIKTVPTRDLLLLVDLSGSMETEDFTSKTGKRVSRLAAVQEVLDDFLSRREGDRVGLVVFGNAAFVQVPFTQDLDVSRMLLEQLSPRMAGPKTALGDAIGLGITLFERSKIKQRVIIALTDGNDTGSQIPPGKAAQIGADNEIVIHTIAVGDPTAVGEEKLDEEALKNLSETTGGRYFFAEDRKQLEGIYDTLDQLETRTVETISHRPRRDLFQWPLAAAFLLSLLFYGWRALQSREVAPSDGNALDSQSHGSITMNPSGGRS